MAFHRAPLAAADFPNPAVVLPTLWLCRVRLELLALQVGVDHHFDQLLEVDLRLPAKLRMGHLASPMSTEMSAGRKNRGS